MVEPLSIIACSAGLVTTCVKLTGYIYTFINKNQLVDTAIRVLGIEIDALSRVLGSISTSFSDPTLAEAALGVQTGHEAQHWRNVRQSMEDCKETLTKLERILEGVGKVQSTSFLRRTKKVVKLNMKGEDIALLKQQVAAYRQTMQLSLQLITVSSVLNNEALSSNLSSRLDSLTIEIHQVLGVLRTPNQSLTMQPNDIDTRVRNNLEACARSASIMVSSAATIVGSRSISGSQAGSYLEEMSDQQKKRVEQWIPNPTIFEDPNENLPTSVSNPSIDDTHSSSQSEIFSDDNCETTTNVTSPMSENNRGFYDDYKQINQVVVEEVVHNLKVDTSAKAVPSEELSTFSTPNIHQLNPTTSQRTSPAATPQLTPITAHDIHVEALQPAAPTSIIVGDLDAKSYSKEGDIIDELWRWGMLRYNEGEFARAELFLEKALNHSKDKYGTEFPERAKLFGTLASACAYQGKREKVEQILDEYNEVADWKHRVLEVLLSGFLEEGKSQQATEIFVKYGKEFIGREGALERLMSMCPKHGCWSMAASITGTYPRFPGRESALEACASACREQSRWDQAEGFLLELSKEKTGNQVKESGIMHSLAEVYFAKKDLKSAQLFCQKAIDLRTIGFGKTHPLFQESIYLIGKIIYEANGDLSEFESFRHVLPPKIQDRLELELLTRMSSSDAAQQLGNTLLKELAPYTPNSRKTSNVDLQSIKATIRTCGVTGAAVRNGDTLLHAFAESGNEVAMQLLIKLGARITTLNKSGYTALQLAVEKGHEPVIDLLLNNGAIVDAQDSAQSPLFRAATLGNIGSVRLMLRHRMRSNWPAPTMLYHTARNGHAEILQILLENGAEDVRNSTTDQSPYFKNPSPRARIRTALHEAVCRGFSVGIIEKLVNADNIKTIDTHSRTPLHEAASGKSIGTVELLLKNGADVFAVDFEGMTALHRAVCTSQPISGAIVKLLLESGAKVDAMDNGGSTPLHLAVFNEEELSPLVVDLLLRHGANVRATQKLIKSALTETAFRQTATSSAVVELLLDHNADIRELLALGYGEADYVQLLGSSATTKLFKGFANSQRSYAQSSNMKRSQPSRSPSLFSSLMNRKLSRNQTACTSIPPNANLRNLWALREDGTQFPRASVLHFRLSCI